MMIVIDHEPRRNESVGVLHAQDEEGVVWRVAADWRPFEAIVGALIAGEEPEIDPEPWSIIGGPIASH